MKKSDLQTGMIVEYRNGEERNVLLGFLGGESILQGGGTWAGFDYIENDLTNMSCSSRDIMAVYSSHKYGDKGNLLWERKEEIVVKELTVAEVSEALGYTVKIVE